MWWYGIPSYAAGLSVCSRHGWSTVILRLAQVKIANHELAGDVVKMFSVDQT